MISLQNGTWLPPGTTPTYDFCGQGWSVAAWSIAFAHGYGTGTQDQWAGTLTLNVLGDNPPHPCPADFNGDGRLALPI